MLRNPAISVALVTATLGANEPTAFAIDPQPYTGCGVLTIGVECPRFVGDDGASFSIVNIGDFQIGDYILVTGTICLDCPSICQEGAVFETKSIEACMMTPPSGPLFSACGTLVQQSGGSVVCTLLQLDSNGSLYAMDIIPPNFRVGDHVRVASMNVVSCVTLCSNVKACINNLTMTECGAPIDACGTVVDYSGGPIFNCTNFISDDGHAYFVENLGPYGNGHRARITGYLEQCPGCKMTNGCIYANQVVGCNDITGDGAVNADDLVALILAWGPCGKTCPADIDASGTVDADDLVLVILNWT